MPLEENTIVDIREEMALAVIVQQQHLVRRKLEPVGPCAVRDSQGAGRGGSESRYICSYISTRLKIILSRKVRTPV